MLKYLLTPSLPTRDHSHMESSSFINWKADLENSGSGIDEGGHVGNHNVRKRKEKWQSQCVFTPQPLLLGRAPHIPNFFSDCWIPSIVSIRKWPRLQTTPMCFGMFCATNSPIMWISVKLSQVTHVEDTDNMQNPKGTSAGLPQRHLEPLKVAYKP